MPAPLRAKPASRPSLGGASGPSAQASNHRRARRVGGVEDRAPAPSVEKDTDVGADQRVGEQERRKAQCDAHGAGLPTGVEQDAAGEAGLKPAVGDLADQPYREKPAEPAL